jgi:hypothetical protein
VQSCEFHWKQSAREVMQRQPERARGLFWRRTRQLTEAPAALYRTVMDKFMADFLNLRRWLEWWDSSETGGTIFPGHPAALDFAEYHGRNKGARPTTNNLNESGNRSSYRLSPRNKAIVEAIDATWREVEMWRGLCEGAERGNLWRGGASPDSLRRKESAKAKKVRGYREEWAGGQHPGNRSLPGQPQAKPAAPLLLTAAGKPRALTPPPPWEHQAQETPPRRSPPALVLSPVPMRRSPVALLGMRCRYVGTGDVEAWGVGEWGRCVVRKQLLKQKPPAVDREGMAVVLDWHRAEGRILSFPLALKDAEWTCEEGAGASVWKWGGSDHLVVLAGERPVDTDEGVAFSGAE